MSWTVGPGRSGGFVWQQRRLVIDGNGCVPRRVQTNGKFRGAKGSRSRSGAADVVAALLPW